MQLAKDRGIYDQIRWLGFHPRPYAILRQADAFVLSSNYEGLPNVVIEAMLCGTPVISTDCPFGPAELIDKDATGYLTPMGDVSSLAGAMRRFLDDPDLKRRLGEEAERRTAERFQTANVVKQYVDVLEASARSRLRGGES